LPLSKSIITLNPIALYPKSIPTTLVHPELARSVNVVETFYEYQNLPYFFANQMWLAGK
jgi:hypothetical protein